jgi:GNAT superfamily N-acetyltransferase
MTTTATADDYQQIAECLGCHGMIANALVIREVWWALRADGPGGWSVVVHRRAGDVAGVMTLLRPYVGDNAYDYIGSMEADDEQAVLALLDTLPAGQVGCFNTYSPRVQAVLDHVCEVTRYPGGPRMTVREERFRPAATEGIHEITLEDAGLFAGLEQPPWDCEGEPGGRHFVVLRDGHAVSRASWIPLMVEPVFAPPIIRITYVATDAHYRRQGLGRQVLSHVTDLVLRAGARPLYWTSVDNFPSQGLAKSLGYEEVARHVCYVWRKPQR